MNKFNTNILKHIIFITLSFVLIACGLEPQGNSNAEVSFAAHIPDNISVKALGKNLIVDELIVGIFIKNGDNEYIESHREIFQITPGSTTANITLSLAKEHTYSFIFWASNSGCNVYDITDLQAIKMQPDLISDPTTFTAMEKMDAFCAQLKDLSMNQEQSGIIPVEMTRPLVLINVGTSGAAYPARFTAKNTGCTYHPFTGNVSGEENYSWNFNQTTLEKFSVRGTDYTYLAMGYLFAETHEKQIECELSAQDRSIIFPKVTIQANYKSNIAGTL